MAPGTETAPPDPQVPATDAAVRELEERLGWLDIAGPWTACGPSPERDE